MRPGVKSTCRAFLCQNKINLKAKEKHKFQKEKTQFKGETHL
jgi:hypothetical protein